jgi:hypothetical protein
VNKGFIQIEKYSVKTLVTPSCKVLWVVTADGDVKEQFSPGRAIKFPYT